MAKVAIPVIPAEIRAMRARATAKALLPESAVGSSLPCLFKSLVISPEVKAVEVGSQTVLFCERSQRLSELNQTATQIWHLVTAGCPASAILDHFHSLGATPKEAVALIQPQVIEWLALGYLTSSEAAAAIRTHPSSALNLGSGDFLIELLFFGDGDADLAADTLGLLRCERGPPQMQIEVVGFQGTDFLFVKGAPRGMTLRHQTVPKIKSLVVEQLCSAKREGFLTHGALLSLDGKRVFLGGAPGAGKTTLSLALVAEGLSYCGDDLVHIRDDGTAEAVPFAATAKSGSWDLLTARTPELNSLPIHERDDGKLVRYYLPRPLDRRGFRPIDVLLLLDRKQDVRARFDPITPLEGLCAILASGYSEQRAIYAQALAALAKQLAGAICARLVYQDLAEAVELTKSCMHENRSRA